MRRQGVVQGGAIGLAGAVIEQGDAEDGVVSGLHVVGARVLGVLVRSLLDAEHREEELVLERPEGNGRVGSDRQRDAGGGVKD